MDTLDLPRVTRAVGRLRLPGSKSISNRTLLLSALSRGATTLTGLLDSDDTRVMRGALEALGVTIGELGSREHVRVIARGRIFWSTPAFFELEHKGPVHQRLGPGLSRESDSFWPISEW